VRLGKREFATKIKGILHIQFSNEQLTSYAGLEVFRRYLLASRFREKLYKFERKVAIGGDFRFAAMVLLIVAMLMVGARRLRHVEFLSDDALVRRFAGLKRIPTERTLSRRLKKFDHRKWLELDRLNELVVKESIVPLDFNRITLDIDGSVLSTGMKVARAARGFNTHNRKNRSYYPIVVTIAQTGHVMAHRNRSGNVHDSRGSVAFLRHAVRTVREQFGFTGIVETRADSAFFKRGFLELCDLHSLEYTIKVPMVFWLNLKQIIKNIRSGDWRWVDRKNQVQGFFTALPINAWKRTERIAIFRKRVNHKLTKPVQLDLFNPDDGTWEHSVVATNKSLELRGIWNFMNGRGIQEKIISELKSGYAYDCIPTNHYGANTAWQKLNILAHNLTTSMQLATVAPPKSRTLKRTTSFCLRSIRTIRFEWLNKAARLLNIAGRRVLRIPDNEKIRNCYEEILEKITEAA
jgi:hypothetical protein